MTAKISAQLHVSWNLHLPVCKSVDKKVHNLKSNCRSQVYARGVRARDTLGGHCDDVEPDLAQPIVAASLGCDAARLRCLDRMLSLDCGKSLTQNPGCAASVCCGNRLRLRIILTGGLVWALDQRVALFEPKALYCGIALYADANP
eukprot:1147761-Pelagomonas_calceolata.AAC.1